MLESTRKSAKMMAGRRKFEETGSRCEFNNENDVLLYVLVLVLVIVMVTKTMGIIVLNTWLAIPWIKSH